MRALAQGVVILLATVLLLGSGEIQCQPVPVATGPTIETDALHYVPGEAVTVSVRPNGTAMEIAGQHGFAVFHVEFGGESGAWLPVRTLYPMGCHVTDCVDGQAIQMCVDPGPPFCRERSEDFEWEWDGYVYIWEEIPCGDTTVEVPRRIAATQGSYRVRLEYGEDPVPGDEPTAEDCAAQDQEIVTDTFEIFWLPD